MPSMEHGRGTGVGRGENEPGMLGTGLVGRAIAKEFPFGRLEGRVAFAHRPDGEILLYRVVRSTELTQLRIRALLISDVRR